MAQRRGMRAAAVDTGFAVAERLHRLGLGEVTWRARKAAARLGFDAHSVEVDGLAVGGSLADHGTYLRLLATFGPHPFHTAVFADAVTDGATVLDCGAHIGLYSLIAARRAGPGGTVVAVEPAPPNAAALRANVERNGFADRVEVVEAAAAAGAGSAPLHMHEMLDQTSLRPAAHGLRETVDVPCVVLDEVLAGRRLDVVKIDVEGAEGAALAGLEETLGSSPGAVAFVECHPRRLAETGVDPAEWAGGLRERGTLEVIDEQGGRVVPATGELVARMVAEHPLSFNLRLVVA